MLKPSQAPASSHSSIWSASCSGVTGMISCGHLPPEAQISSRTVRFFRRTRLTIALCMEWLVPTGLSSSAGEGGVSIGIRSSGAHSKREARNLSAESTGTSSPSPSQRAPASDSVLPITGASPGMILTVPSRGPS